MPLTFLQCAVCHPCAGKSAPPGWRPSGFGAARPAFGGLFDDPDPFGTPADLKGTQVGVAMAILVIAAKTGTFSVTSPELFWTMFKDHLCVACRAKLESLSNLKAQARAKLEEAVRLDKGNRAAAENLAAVKNMI